MKYMKWLFQFDLRARLDGGFKHFLFFTPNLGEMIQFDEHIFFRWVETQPPTKEDQLSAQQNGCFRK